MDGQIAWRIKGYSIRECSKGWAAREKEEKNDKREREAGREGMENRHMFRYIDRRRHAWKANGRMRRWDTDKGHEKRRKGTKNGTRGEKFDEREGGRQYLSTETS